MYRWKKSVNPRWLGSNEERLRAEPDTRLVIIERPERKRIQLEVYCDTAKKARDLVKKFGGRMDRLSRDWLEVFSREQKSKPIRIGKRLVVFASEKASRARRPLAPQAGSLCHVIIPAGVAFGTGEHVTTAMSLRLLEKISRKRKFGWSLVDLGTGSGILALAARRFGAKRVVAIDHDAQAMATARANARMNKISNIDWRIADVRHWQFPGKIDIVTANLFSGLLLEILPKLKAATYLILSGILREQEREIRRALRANKIDIVEVRRRGKWIAILANCRTARGRWRSIASKLERI